MRVFLPATPELLRTLQEQRRLPAPLPGHAVTAALRATWPDADQDELDYAVLMAAAYDSLQRVADGRSGNRRVVIVADVADREAAAAAGEVPSAVLVTGPVELAQVAALYADDPAAAPEVRAAAALVPAASAGDAAALEVVALPDHELMWYASQELPDLLG